MKARTGWKVAVAPNGDLVLVKLQILGQIVTPVPSEYSTKVNHTKRRTDKVKVLGMRSMKNANKRSGLGVVAYSASNRILGKAWGLTYIVGQEVSETVDTDLFNKCSYGIHFFDTVKEVRDFCDYNGWVRGKQ